jgi:hypothetical protein
VGKSRVVVSEEEMIVNSDATTVAVVIAANGEDELATPDTWMPKKNRRTASGIDFMKLLFGRKILRQSFTSNFGQSFIQK